MNEKKVLEGKVPWTIEGMRNRFSKAIGNWYMTSFAIEGEVVGEESVMAELIDLIAMQDIHPENGLSEIKLSYF